MSVEARDGALRGVRTTTGVTDQDHRIGVGAGAQARINQTGRGALINYYDDLNINTSADNANQIRKEEKEFNSSVAGRQAGINEYKNKVDSAYNTTRGAINSAGADFPDSYKSAIDQVWNTTKKDFVYIDVYGENNKIEGSYLFPKEAAEEMHKTSFDGSEMHFASDWGEDGHLRVGTRPVGAPSSYGKELHESLSQGVVDTYNSWYSMNAPTIQEGYDKGYKAFLDAYGSLESQYSMGADKATSAQIELDGSVAKRAGEWDTIRNNQKQRSENNRGVLSNLKIESV